MEVRFPGLGLEFTVNSTAFTLFGRSIEWYGVLIATGFLLAALYAFRRAKQDYHIDTDRMMDAVLLGAIGAVIGARLYYVAFDTTGQFLENPISILYIWEGGLAFYGAFIGALLAGIPAAKWRKISILGLLDLGGLGFVIGQSIGRWGNFFNQEAFGNNTSMPWGMISDKTIGYLQDNQTSLEAAGVAVDPLMPVHPCFLYESLWLLLGFIVLHLVSKKRKYDGQVFFLYIIWSGAGRIWIEALRTDSLYILGMKVSQLLALLMILFGVLMMVLYRNKRNPEPEPTAVMAGEQVTATAMNGAEPQEMGEIPTEETESNTTDEQGECE